MLIRLYIYRLTVNLIKMLINKLLTEILISKLDVFIHVNKSSLFILEYSE